MVNLDLIDLIEDISCLIQEVFWIQICQKDAAVWFWFIFPNVQRSAPVMTSYFLPGSPWGKRLRGWWQKHEDRPKRPAKLLNRRLAPLLRHRFSWQNHVKWHQQWSKLQKWLLSRSERGSTVFGPHSVFTLSACCGIRILPANPTSVRTVWYATSQNKRFLRDFGDINYLKLKVFKEENNLLNVFDGKIIINSLSWM